MRPDRLLIRFVRLGGRRQLMLAEALAAIACASLAVRFLPFERAVRLGSRRLVRTRSGTADTCHETRWSVTAVGSRVPWRALCFQRGLALQWMLRRRGVDAVLHYGIGHVASGDLAAHVWIEADHAIILGGEEAPSFTSVAAFP